MTEYARQVAYALTIGLITSTLVSVIAHMYPTYELLIVVGWTLLGIGIATGAFLNWFKSAKIGRTGTFIIGAFNAIFGLAIALASTEALVYLFIFAALIDVFVAYAKAIIATVRRLTGPYGIR